MTKAQRDNIRRYLKVKSYGKRRKNIDGEKIECQQCGSKEELEWHHKQLWSEGGDDSPENLQVLCRQCHLSAHKDANDFRKNGQWGGLVSAYLREQRLGRKQFCETMRKLSKLRRAA